MPETAGGISPLDWGALVAEAVRRRKVEKLTQKEHAALAVVSVPTMIAFERGERSLSLGKALDILGVVGLVARNAIGDTHDAFVQKAFSRWRDLIKDLPTDSPGRFPAGWYRIDYVLEGDLRDVDLHQLKGLLDKAVVPHTGWPMFVLRSRNVIAAIEIDGVIERWLSPERDSPVIDAAHCDFWRVGPSGHAFIIRGYYEDEQEPFSAGRIFEITLPILRLGEAFLHAARLAKLIARDPQKTTVKMRALYSGLSGRELRAWESPRSADHFRGDRSRSNEALLENSVPAADIEDNLVEYVLPMIVSLYERFGVTGLSKSFVSEVLDRMRANNFV